MHRFDLQSSSRLLQSNGLTFGHSFALDDRMKKALIPYTFNLLNLAIVAGLYHFLRRTTASEIWIEHGEPAAHSTAMVTVFDAP